MQAADAIEPRAAGDAVGERDAVEEERARERAEQEVLERRFGRRRRVAPDAGQHVDRERQDLEREEDDQQVGRRRHQHHAGDREQHQRVVLAAPAAARARSSAPENASDSMPTTIRIDGDEQPEVVGDDDAEARRVAVPQQRRDAIAAPTRPIDAEPADRHPLAGIAEGLGDHRGDGRPRRRRPSGRSRSKDDIIGCRPAARCAAAAPGSAGAAAMHWLEHPLDRRLHRPQEQVRQHAHQDRQRDDRHDHAHSRGCRSGSVRVLLVRDRRRRSRAGTSRACRPPTGSRRSRRTPPAADPSGTRRAGSGTRRRSR